MFRSLIVLGILTGPLAALLADDKPVKIFKGHTRPVRAAVFSPDGKQVLSGANDDTARLWDIASGKTIAIFRGRREITSRNRLPE